MTTLNPTSPSSDSSTDHQEDVQQETGTMPEAEPKPPSGIERRMNVRAYNHWSSLLNGRTFPSVDDIKQEDLGDLANNAILLDFSADPTSPAVCFIGDALREECGLENDYMPLMTVDTIPARSLISRLVAHYCELLQVRAPIGFEAEFISNRGNTTNYRGILMPLSKQNDLIDHIFGVISWKEASDQVGNDKVFFEEKSSKKGKEGEDALDLGACDEISFIESGPELPETPDQVEEKVEKQQALPPQTECAESSDSSLSDQSNSLQSSLNFAREAAQQFALSEGRSRAALYHALGQTYSLSHLTRNDIEGLMSLCKEAGIKNAKAFSHRLIIRLVFGIDCDKTRLAEFSAALSYADRHQVDHDKFEDYITNFEGGLKGLVAAERASRKQDRGEAPPAACPNWMDAPAVTSLTMEVDIEDGAPFVLIARKSTEDNKVEILGAAKTTDKQLAQLKPL